MNKEKVKDIIIAVLIIGGIILFVYYCLSSKDNIEATSGYEPTKEDELYSQIQDLKNQNEDYEDEISHLQSRIEELEGEYKNSEELIDILREQLESYGIEPDDL